MSAKNVARDGSTWSPLGDGLDDEVEALLPSTTGRERLSTPGGYLNAGQVAKWDGSH